MTDEIKDEQAPSEPDAVGDETASEEEETRRNLFTPNQVTKKDLDAVFGRIERMEKDIKKSIESKNITTSSGDVDLDRILEVKSATEGLDTREIQTLRLISKQKKVPLNQARQDDDFVLWQDGYKKKVELENVKNNIPTPSTTQNSSNVAKSIKDMPIEDRTKLFKELGLIKAHKPPELVE
jgi:hypothetical protein